MTAIPLQQTMLTYESQELQEVFRPCEVPSRDNDAGADPSFTAAPETARTRRLRNELDKVNVSAVVFYGAGLVPIVLVAMLFF